MRPINRKRRIALVATLAGMTLALAGQIAGGLLVSANILGSSWRPVFLLNVPIGAALLVAGHLRRQHLGRRGGEHDSAPPASGGHRPAPLWRRLLCRLLRLATQFEHSELPSLRHHGLVRGDQHQLRDVGLTRLRPVLLSGQGSARRAS